MTNYEKCWEELKEFVTSEKENLPSSWSARVSDSLYTGGKWCAFYDVLVKMKDIEDELEEKHK